MEKEDRRCIVRRCGLKQPEGAQVCPACNYEGGKLPCDRTGGCGGGRKAGAARPPPKSRTGRSGSAVLMLGGAGARHCAARRPVADALPAQEQKDESFFYFENDLCQVSVDGKWGYIDKTGETVLEPPVRRRARLWGQRPCPCCPGGKMGLY